MFLFPCFPSSFFFYFPFLFKPSPSPPPSLLPSLPVSLSLPSSPPPPAPPLACWIYVLARKGATTLCFAASCDLQILFHEHLSERLLNSWLYARPIPMHCLIESSAVLWENSFIRIASMRKLWPDSQTWYVAEPESEIRSSGSFFYWVGTLCFSLELLLAKEPHLSMEARQLWINTYNMKLDCGSRFPSDWAGLGQVFKLCTSESLLFK